MKVTVDFIDKVVLYKGRVWTIYSTSNDGVFAYQGLKPFDSFKYYEDSQRYDSFKKNITFIKHDEIELLPADHVPAAVKKEERELKKPLSRKKAIDFFVYLTGHSKTFVSKHIRESNCKDSFIFSPGAITYDIWKAKRSYSSQPYLLLSHNMEGSTTHSYFDYITFETDDLETERSWKEVKQEIIDGYKEWKGIE